MKVEFKTSFLSDLRRIQNEKIVLLVKGIIDELLVIDDFKRVKNLKKMIGYEYA